jgi:hypothetical protein
MRSSRARRIAGCFGNTTLVVQWRRVLARGAGPRVRGVGRFFKWLQEDGTMYWSECMETTARSRLLDGLSAPPNAFYVRFLLVYCNARTTTSVDEQDQITTTNGGERNLRVCALDPCVFERCRQSTMLRVAKRCKGAIEREGSYLSSLQST